MPEQVKSSGASPSPSRGRRGRFSGIRLGSVGGFEISLDYSWFVILVLIVASFSTAVFPPAAPGHGRTVYILMALVGALLFFTSLLVHELAHSFVARAKGIEVEGITLFIFGGMARTSREASTPGDEFLIAAAGPLASFALAVLFSLVASAAPSIGLGLEFVVVAEYLGVLNLVLAVFNLLPGFPLDGGRLFRAALWRVSGSFRRATRIASGVGRGLGWVLIGLGIYSFFGGNGFIGGLWLVFIGWFLAHAARMSYQQVLLQEMLGPLTAAQAMSPEPETVSPDLPIERLVHEHFLRMPYSAFPVTDDGVLIGLITLGKVRGLPKEDWKDRRVGDIMIPMEELTLLPPETPMTAVLETMRNGDTRRVLVARDWELLGIISSTDIARWLDRAALIE
jgi:Zn-dependent protease/CBS domain-containing protein